MAKKGKNPTKGKNNFKPEEKIPTTDELNLTSAEMMKKRDGEDFSSTIQEKVLETSNDEKTDSAESDYLSDSVSSVPAKEKKVRIFPIVLVALLIIGGLGFGVYYMYQKGYYNDRWYENTEINSIDVSGQTFDEAKKNITEKLWNYTLTIHGRYEGVETINGDDIDYSFSFPEDFEDTFKKQHKHFSLLPKKNTYHIDFNVDYNQKKLKKLLKSSVLLKGSVNYRIVAPQSAFIQYSDISKRYECIGEVLGNKLIKTSFIEAVTNAVEDGKIDVDLTDQEQYPDIYKAPKLSAEDQEIKDQLEASNNAALRYIVWNMGKGVTEEITPTEISSWIIYKDGEIHYDYKAVGQWVEDFCLKYKTVGISRKVKMHNKKYVTVKGGDYGWQIDYERALKQAKNSLKEKISKKDIEKYLEDPSEENKEALTFKKKVPYSGTAFQKDYDNYKVDWDTENYTEVSLKKQMVYIFRKGKVAYSFKCITGRPTPERSTKPGAYFIKEHQRQRVLRGDDYETPVTNWVRITWTGTGFHSANWQRWSSWSPNYYKTRGSHGCVNLSVADSAKVYDIVKYKEAVFIY